MYESRAGTKTRPTRTSRTVAQRTMQRVTAASSMDAITFAMHMTRRHPEHLGGARQLDPERMDYSTEQSYRAFHFRLHHADDPQGRAAIENMHEPHFHDPDSLQDSIDRAIECLMQNRDWGWHEISRITGLVATFPDGQLATRVKGIVKHHGTIEDATDRLIDATEEAERVAKARRRR